MTGSNKLAEQRVSRTDSEWLEAFRRGERVTSESSRFPEELDMECDHPRFRVVVCTNDWDVVECYRCGWQRETTCSFDDEYS